MCSWLVLLNDSSDKFASTASASKISLGRTWMENHRKATTAQKSHDEVPSFPLSLESLASIAALMMLDDFLAFKHYLSWAKKKRALGSKKGEHFRPGGGDGIPHPFLLQRVSGKLSDACLCTTCGSCFTTLEQLRKHSAHRAEIDSEKNLAVELCHPDRVEVESSPTRYDILEVVVLVDGVEGTTGSTVQSRHSYLIPDDIGLDMEFAMCVVGGERNCVVNLNRFHQLLPMKSAWED